MRLDHCLRFSVIPGDWHLKWVRGCSAVQNQGVDKETEHQTSTGKVHKDRQTYRQSETGGPLAEWGDTTKIKTRPYEEEETDEERGGQRGIEVLKGKRKDFKGLREQMANCTRVSQPGSKSVLCIRTGVGGGRGRGKGKGPWRELGGVIRP